jgi:hypothetical protein
VSNKNRKKTQSGSKLFDVLDPILRIALIKIIKIMKELMSANSVAVGFITGSFHNILSFDQACFMPIGEISQLVETKKDCIYR